MRISDVTKDMALLWARSDEPEADCELMGSVIMPAALRHLIEYTGQELYQLNEKPDLAVAYLALCAFMYDNRSMNISTDKENRVIQSFLDRYQVNLVPKE